MNNMLMGTGFEIGDIAKIVEGITGLSSAFSPQLREIFNRVTETFLGFNYVLVPRIDDGEWHKVVRRNGRLKMDGKTMRRENRIRFMAYLHDYDKRMGSHMVILFQYAARTEMEVCITK